MSWDAIKGIRQGEKDAREQAKAKRRGAALGRGAGSRKSKSGFSRSAGRAAVSKMKIRGRGVSIETHKNGKSFSRRIDYAQDSKKQAELIYSNADIRSMRAAAKLRPDIREPIGHISMSLPPSSGKIAKDDWAALVETARSALGLDDTFPLLASRHNDRDHDHVHMIFSRVSVIGKVHDQANLGLRCAATERILEDTHSLKLVPPSEFKTHGHTTNNEIEKGVRTRQKPARLQIADALKIAVQGKPSTQQFVERLQAAGIGVKANVATTGRMNGFSFTYCGVAFSGSKISKEFGWAALSGRIDYEQNRDAEFLAQCNGNPGSASHTLAATVATVDQLNTAVGAINTAVARVSTTTADNRANIPDSSPAPGRTGELARPTKQAQARPVAPAQPATVAGFARTAILDSGLRSWASSLPCRINRARVLANKEQQHALYDVRDRAAAIRDAAGFAIPEARILTDDQLVALLRDLGGDQIEVLGNPDFCNRVEDVARNNGLNVEHEFQIVEQIEVDNFDNDDSPQLRTGGP